MIIIKSFESMNKTTCGEERILHPFPVLLFELEHLVSSSVPSWHFAPEVLWSQALVAALTRVTAFLGSSAAKQICDMQVRSRSWASGFAAATVSPANFY